MPIITDTPLSSTSPPPCRGPDAAVPPGWTWVLKFRRTRRQRWVTLFTAPTGAAEWDLMCSQPCSGHYHPLLVRVEDAELPTGRFDAASPARQDRG